MPEPTLTRNATTRSKLGTFVAITLAVVGFAGAFLFLVLSTFSLISVPASFSFRCVEFGPRRDVDGASLFDIERFCNLSRWLWNKAFLSFFHQSVNQVILINRV